MADGSSGCQSPLRRGLEDSEDEVDTAAACDQLVVARAENGTAFYLYNHQAGGHKPFLQTASGQVCKPAIPLEVLFYETLDQSYTQLKPFVPPFEGVITVDLHLPPPPATAAGNGMSALPLSRVTSVGSTTSSNGEDVDPTPPSTSERIAPPTSITPAKKRRRPESRPHAPVIVPNSRKTRTPSPTSSSYSARLWRASYKWNKPIAPPAAAAGKASEDCASGASSTLREYLVLGDLTQDFYRPCVLDIKMGTRQHGEDASPAKVKSQSAKCAATTSLELGLRLCGMQIYDHSDKQYKLWDKHWGRKLKVDDIEPALETFLLAGGAELPMVALQTFIKKLAQLRSVVETTTGLRFWGASLLLVYDGDDRVRGSKAAPKRQEVRLIDFAHCQMSSSFASPDEGLLLGLTNIDLYLRRILERATAAAAEAEAAAISQK